MEVEEEQGAKEEKEKGESNPCQTGGQCVFCLSPTAESFSVCGECLAKTGNYQCKCPDNFYGTNCEKSTFGFAQLHDLPLLG